MEAVELSSLVDSKKKLELVDLKNEGNLKVHWTTFKNLPQILVKGIYSPKFARRIKDREYEANWVYDPEDEYVWTMPAPGSHHDYEKVGIIFLGTKEFPQRVAPRKFIGLCVDDTCLFVDATKEEIDQKREEALDVIGQIKAELGKLGINMAIYGTSGDLYWPIEIDHEEIVQMLEEKQK